MKYSYKTKLVVKKIGPLKKGNKFFKQMAAICRRVRVLQREGLSLDQPLGRIFTQDPSSLASISQRN